MSESRPQRKTRAVSSHSQEKNWAAIDNISCLIPTTVSLFPLHSSWQDITVRYGVTGPTVA